MLSVYMLSVKMLNVVMLNVIILSDVTSIYFPHLEIASEQYQQFITVKLTVLNTSLIFLCNVISIDEFYVLKLPMQVLTIIVIVGLTALSTSFILLSDAISIEYFLSSQIAITSDGGNL